MFNTGKYDKYVLLKLCKSYHYQFRKLKRPTIRYNKYILVNIINLFPLIKTLVPNYNCKSIFIIESSTSDNIIYMRALKLIT